MPAILILTALAVFGSLVYIQAKAHQQLDVETPAGTRQASDIVRQQFRDWKPVSGPGTYNFQPRQRDHAPTLSITVNGTDVSSTVTIWASRYDSSYRGMYHATLLWWRQRGLVKELTRDDLPVPGFLSANSHMVSTLRVS